ncbi:MAG: zinc ABC transporter substrate-binding protein [candidate division Zixibacteria bacterium]
MNHMKGKFGEFSKKYRLLCIILSLCVFLILGGCGKISERRNRDLSQAESINILATTGMIGDLAAHIGGERVAVSTLMGPGIDPHLYKASQRDVITLANADIIFFNGLHLEGAMSEVLEQMESSGITVAVAGSVPEEELLSPEEFSGAHDPHVWFDVQLWIHAAESVYRTLAKLDSAHAETYSKNFESYRAELERLHEFVLNESAKIPEDVRVLITAHDAFNYFGRAYGFEVRGLQGISTASEAGTADVQKLAAFIVEKKIPAIFIESSVPQRNIEAVQAAVAARDFEVVIGGELFSDSMGDTSTPEGTYVGMVEHNINTIVAALTGSGSNPE